MFLSQLSPEQKNSFLALATRMVLADGTVEPEENERLNAIRDELGPGVKAPPEEVFGTTNPAPFDTRRSRLVVLWELMVMGFADDRFHPDESAVLNEVCRAYRITWEEREHIEALAKIEARLLREGFAFIGG
jgi:tellurite resistance protein